MLGAIIGDIIGSTYEFNNVRDKDVSLFSNRSHPTDDTIMTIAVCDIFQKGYINSKEKIVDTIKFWARAYPDAGYGHYFGRWAFSNDNNPYYSNGNGAAMRISPVAYYASSKEEVIKYARLLTEVTHNHPEGLKGAEVVAMCIYMARKGKSKKYIKEYVEKYYYIDFNFEDLKEENEFDDTCEGSIPQAIYCFLISTSYIDCIRNCIAIGGDCDTTSAIAGAIAEAYYKHIDESIIKKALSLIYEEDPSPLDVIYQFLDDFKDDYLTSELITSKTYFLTIENKYVVFEGHCKKISPLKDKIISYLEEQDYLKIEDIKKLLKNVVNFDELENKVSLINTLIKETGIKFILSR